MAQAGFAFDKDQFNCPICLDVLKTPVTIPCGHSYCFDCIQNYWDQDDYLGVFGCPQCRQSFSPRPALARNTVLADVVDRFRRIGLQQADATPDQSLARAGDVECDVCSGRKHRAVRSCLVCLASYCELHLQPHYESGAFKRHKLVPASGKLQDSVCPRHDKLLDLYCRTDGQCICCVCVTEEHKGHDSVQADAEMQHKQQQLDELKQSSQMRIRQREEMVQELRQAIMTFTRSAHSAAEESNGIFTELIRSMELKRFEVRELIKAQEKTAVNQAEELLQKIQKEIGELKKNMAELDNLSRDEDHVHFLQSFHSVCAPPVLSLLPSVNGDPKLTFGLVMSAVSEFKGLLHEVCQGGFVSIYEKVKDVVIVGSSNPDVQLNSSERSDAESPVQLEATTASVRPGLDQSPLSPLNPFLAAPGPIIPTFGTSPFGVKLSSGTRLRHAHRRAHSRRK
ncbi:finTRIM family, member 67 [Thalassophryne amazonica]|uniref:finTRIM family, member 67 n=1 Tax=Thalassophryne amazonica TaxID=390379 RepID=UPI001472394B|nr:finTRIM family, member 67 [Thalassophryne amazonica]